MVKARNWTTPQERSQSSTTFKFVSVVFGALLLFFIRTLLLIIRESSRPGYTNPAPSTLYSPTTKVRDTPTVIPLLKSEDQFRQTLVDCRPGLDSKDKSLRKKCLQHIPNGGKVQRIAILSPEGQIRGIFTSWLKHALLEYYDHDEARMNNAIELTQTSHVPPYGYGKNHGWTKIIRLVHFPFVQHILDSANFGNGQGGINISKSDILQVTKQVIRWHCRLSHVAAHTALWTVDFTSPDLQWTQILDFIISTPSTIEGDTADHWSKIDTIKVEVQKQLELFQSQASRVYSELVVPEYLRDMENVLEHEMSTTENLKKWPCLSFWEISTESGDLPSVSMILANKLVPNCLAPFTTCSVNRDKCEEMGDALCKKKTWPVTFGA